MRSKKLRWLALPLMGAFMLAASGCGGGGHYYRAYDPDYHDYHSWNSNEAGYYHRWEGDTHRNHVEYRKRNKNEQHEYWKWRHDHDHDHDHH